MYPALTIGTRIHDMENNLIILCHKQTPNQKLTSKGECCIVVNHRFLTATAPAFADDGLTLADDSGATFTAGTGDSGSDSGCIGSWLWLSCGTGAADVCRCPCGELHI
jgi:hypothetical protein